MRHHPALFGVASTECPQWERCRCQQHRFRCNIGGRRSLRGACREPLLLGPRAAAAVEVDEVGDFQAIVDPPPVTLEVGPSQVWHHHALQICVLLHAAYNSSAWNCQPLSLSLDGQLGTDILSAELQVRECSLQLGRRPCRGAWAGRPVRLRLPDAPDELHHINASTLPWHCWCPSNPRQTVPQRCGESEPHAGSTTSRGSLRGIFCTAVAAATRPHAQLTFGFGTFEGRPRLHCCSCRRRSRHAEKCGGWLRQPSCGGSPGRGRRNLLPTVLQRPRLRPDTCTGILEANGHAPDKPSRSPGLRPLLDALCTTLRCTAAAGAVTLPCLPALHTVQFSREVSGCCGCPSASCCGGCHNSSCGLPLFLFLLIDAVLAPFQACRGSRFLALLLNLLCGPPGPAAPAFYAFVLDAALALGDADD
mmetsp:Transcript_50876/g.164637  ORF Transcript_50876/g.164637 Transcript_50876/m.164637 type:complete len:420 (-) Transcript_50876:951-2210(-)